MDLFSQHIRARRLASQYARRAAALSTASVAVLMLAACAHHGLDDVKPTATTAYRTAQPGGTQPPPAAPRQ